MRTVTLEHVHEDIKSVKKDLEFLKQIITEDFELSSWAKKELVAARKTGREKYIQHKEIEKEFSS